MTDVVAVFLEMFGWSNDMITIADVINNIVRLAIGIGIFVFIMKMPAISLVGTVACYEVPLWIVIIVFL